MQYRPVVLLIIAAVFASACGGAIGRTKRAYEQGRYLEVEERLAKEETELSQLPFREQIDYGLYRGKALMMLGDYASAQQWVDFAEMAIKQAPQDATVEQTSELDRTRWTLRQAISNARLGRDQVIPPPGVGTIVVRPAPTTAPSEPSVDVEPETEEDSLEPDQAPDSDGDGGAGGGDGSDITPQG